MAERAVTDEQWIALEDAVDAYLAADGCEYVILSAQSVAREVSAGRLTIAPYSPINLQPASYDLALLDATTIYPGQFALGCTLERVHLPADLAAQLSGRSTWGRRGLMVHVTAGWIDPGFAGQITLELLNVSNKPLDLAAGEKICQIIFHRLDQPTELPYGSPSLRSHYMNQRGITPARDDGCPTCGSKQPGHDKRHGIPGPYPRPPLGTIKGVSTK